MDDFQNVFNAANNDDLVELHIEDDNTMKVLISGSLKMEYTLRLIEKSEVNTPIPRVEAKSKYLNNRDSCYVCKQPPKDAGISKVTRLNN